jgi:NADPH:quinone reductase-like Zn-dependent oxidoreductase
MRAVISKAPGDAHSLLFGELPTPSCGPGMVRIRVAAVAINYPDALMIEDRYQFRPPRPFAPGGEISGIIEEIGPGVSNLAVGMRVLALTTFGGMAEQVAVAADRAFEIPPTMPFDVAAGLLMTYGTALHALTERAGLRAGEVLLVLGGAGGVGTATIELGKAMGARVVAGVSSAAKAEIARQAGADELYVYPRAPFDTGVAREITQTLKTLAGPAGFDVILDPLGGSYAEPALRSIGWEGRYLVVGFTAGIGAMPMNLMLLKGCQMIGVFWGDFVERNRDALREELSLLFGYWERGQIAPIISARFDFPDGALAIAALANREGTGKVIVVIDPKA